MNAVFWNSGLDWQFGNPWAAEDHSCPFHSFYTCTEIEQL
ncbi:hypothetical protein ACP4OV_025720 [Aristida adscensionis]